MANENGIEANISKAGGKACRACTDFRSWMKVQGTRPNDNVTKETKIAQSSGEESPKNDTSTSETKSQEKSTISEDPPLWGSAKQYGCPSDITQLGRGTWQFIHTMAAYYPAQPTPDVQTDMTQFIGLFSKFYPCNICATDFRNWLKDNTPNVSSQSTLSRWFCDAHNVVNKKLGKDLFNCDLVDQRWRDGWQDTSCD